MEQLKNLQSINSQIKFSLKWMILNLLLNHCLVRSWNLNWRTFLCLLEQICSIINWLPVKKRTIKKPNQSPKLWKNKKRNQVFSETFCKIMKPLKQDYSAHYFSKIQMLNLLSFSQILGLLTCSEATLSNRMALLRYSAIFLAWTRTKMTMRGTKMTEKEKKRDKNRILIRIRKLFWNMNTNPRPKA